MPGSGALVRRCSSRGRPAPQPAQSKAATTPAAQISSPHGQAFEAGASRNGTGQVPCRSTSAAGEGADGGAAGSASACPARAIRRLRSADPGLAAVGSSAIGLAAALQRRPRCAGPARRADGHAPGSPCFGVQGVRQDDGSALPSFDPIAPGADGRSDNRVLAVRDCTGMAVRVGSSSGAESVPVLMPLAFEALQKPPIPAPQGRLAGLGNPRNACRMSSMSGRIEPIAANGLEAVGFPWR